MFKILLATKMQIKVCFLVSDNGSSQIFCNCFNLDEVVS